jgi:hypothetical protein
MKTSPFSLKRLSLLSVAAFFTLGSARLAATTLQFSGTVSYETDGTLTTVLLTAGAIENLDSGGTSGTIRMELWAFAEPYTGGSSSGYRMAVYSLPGLLPGGSSFVNVSSGTITFIPPPNGAWYVSMLLTEYTGQSNDDGFVTRDYVDFPQQLIIGNPPPTPTPSITPTPSPTPKPSPSPTPPGVLPLLANISTRCLVETGDNVMIGGFIVEGSAPKSVIIRAIGPSLSAFGISNPLTDPKLELHDGTGALIATNDNWQTTQLGGIITSDQVSEIQNSQLAPTQAKESAIVATLSPGRYTAIVSGANGTTGVALVEVYDLSPPGPSPSLLGNVSTRSLVQTGDNVMIGGFIVQGSAPKNVVLRAIGPSLSAFGISNPLTNPKLELHDGTGALIAANDDWQTTQLGGIITSDQVSVLEASQLAPTQANESAIFATLPPGSYTAIVSGANNTTGVGLVEVFDLDLQITSVAETTPVALTPLSVSANGIDPSQPVTVHFYNDSGFDVTTPAVRVEGGTVIVGVPVYFDPTSNTEMAGTVSMTVSQGSHLSPPVTIDIQDIPALATYGTALGQISHSVLIYQAQLLGRRLNELQALQVLPGNTVDTSGAQATLKTQLNSVIAARSDVDRVMADNSLVIYTGSLPDGTPVQFDRNSLEMMDRINALFLLQTIGPVTPGTQANLKMADLMQSPSSAASTITTVLEYMETQAAVNSIQASALNLTNAKGWSDVAGAIASGISGTAALLPKGVITEASEWMLGAGAALISDANIVTEALLDDGFYLYGAATNDQNLMNTALEAMNAVPTKDIVKASLNLTATLFGAPEAVPLLQKISTVYEFADSFYELGEAAEETAENLYESIDAEFPSPFPDETQGLAMIQGLADISNTTGTAAPLSGLDLCCLGGTDIQGIADPEGNFTVYVPLGVAGTDYSGLSLEVYDPLGGAILSAETVDLTGLNTSQPVIVPDLFGTCDDSDAGDPDGDDPDCD